MVWGSFTFVIAMYALELFGECILVEENASTQVEQTFENWMVFKTILAILQTIIVLQVCFYLAFMKMNAQSLHKTKKQILFLWIYCTFFNLFRLYLTLADDKAK